MRQDEAGIVPKKDAVLLVAFEQEAAHGDVNAAKMCHVTVLPLCSESLCPTSATAATTATSTTATTTIGLITAAVVGTPTAVADGSGRGGRGGAASCAAMAKVDDPRNATEQNEHEDDDRDDSKNGHSVFLLPTTLSPVERRQVTRRRRCRQQGSSALLHLRLLCHVQADLKHGRRGDGVEEDVPAQM